MTAQLAQGFHGQLVLRPCDGLPAERLTQAGYTPCVVRVLRAGGVGRVGVGYCGTHGVFTVPGDRPVRCTFNRK